VKAIHTQEPASTTQCTWP